MSSTLVKEWFDKKFHDLSEEIQQLHINGGTLKGLVEVTIGKGIAGLIGKKICKKFGLSGPGPQYLVVKIYHKEDGLHWDRLFNHSTVLKSTFTPVGNIRHGYWVEKSGAIELRLTVEIRKGGWYWIIQSCRYHGIRIPLWIFPRIDAYKRMEDGRYRFFVNFSWPILGRLFSYSGLLSLDDKNV